MALNLKRLTQIERKIAERSAVDERVPLPLPQPKQAEFINCTADIALYGGSAGAGKSMALLLDFAKDEFIENPQYGAVIFRRQYPELKAPGGLWSESFKLYPHIGGVGKQGNLKWDFPSGACIKFSHLQHEKNIYNWQGSQLTRVGFDELTLFTEYQFFYILTRMRSVSGIKPQLRATCNPDADSWLATFIDWWIGADGYPIPERSGVIRWFIKLNNDILWAENPEILQQKYPDIPPKSFTFISAKISDNQILLSKDPDYLANLKSQHPVDVERLLYGNWKIRYEAGKVFNRSWFEIVDSIPGGSIFDQYYSNEYSYTHHPTIRFWDLAATPASLATDSFWTCGVKLTYIEGYYYVLDVVAVQACPADVDELIVSTALSDGAEVQIRWEQEPGSAGVRDAEHIRNKLYEFDAKPVRPMGSKLSRSRPFASEAAKGNVRLIKADWNETYLNALHSFDGQPRPLTNDVVDASAGAFLELSDTAQAGNYLNALIS